MDTSSIQQVKELYDKFFECPIAIRNIFIDYYGEENVDSTIPTLEVVELYLNNRQISIDTLLNIYTDLSITVKFPEVTITNENGNSVNAKNIFALVPLRMMMVGNNLHCLMSNAFTLSRSHYYESHVIADYMHSHCNGIPFVNGRSSFLECCLGSGPIRRTILTLCTEYDESLWELFCFELDSYVKTESIAGVPWRRMSTISSTPYSANLEDNRYNTYHVLTCSGLLYDVFKDFIPYFIRTNKIPFCYTDGSYMVAMSYVDFALLVSNKFIEWMNREDNPHRNVSVMEKLRNSKILSNYIIVNNKINSLKGSGDNVSSRVEFLRGRHLLVFKGEAVTIEIESDLDSTSTLTSLLSSRVVGYIATLITKSVNYYYGNKYFESAGSEAAINCKYKFL